MEHAVKKPLVTPTRPEKTEELAAETRERFRRVVQDLIDRFKFSADDFGWEKEEKKA